jgi:hypothetical protein
MDVPCALSCLSPQPTVDVPVFASCDASAPGSLTTTYNVKGFELCKVTTSQSGDGGASETEECDNSYSDVTPASPAANTAITRSWGASTDPVLGRCRADTNW